MSTIEATYDTRIDSGVTLGESKTATNQFNITFDALGDGVTDHFSITPFNCAIDLGSESLSSMSISGAIIEKVEVGEFDDVTGDDLRIYFSETVGNDLTVYGHPVTNHILTLTNVDFKNRLEFIHDLQTDKAIPKIIASTKDNHEKLKALFDVFDSIENDDPRRLAAIDAARPVLESYLSNQQWKTLSEAEKLDFWFVFSVAGLDTINLRGKFPAWSFHYLWEIVTNENNNYQDRALASFSLAGAEDRDLPEIKRFLDKFTFPDEIGKGTCMSLAYSHVNKESAKEIIRDTKSNDRPEIKYLLELLK